MFNRGNHSIYLIQYHIVFCTKYRYKALNSKIQTRLKEVIRGIADIYGFTILEIEIMPEHVHIFVSTKPTDSPTSIVGKIKSVSAIRLFVEFPNLRKIFRDNCPLWSKGYFVCSIGNANPETIRNYIKNQKFNS